MLEKIKREVSYIAPDYRHIVLTVTIDEMDELKKLEKIKIKASHIAPDYRRIILMVKIDGKEYWEGELRSDGDVTVSPEPLEDQLQRLVPDVDIELIEHFVDNVKKATTMEDLRDAKMEWDSLVRNGGTENA